MAPSALAPLIDSQTRGFAVSVMGWKIRESLLFDWLSLSLCSDWLLSCNILNCFASKKEMQPQLFIPFSWTRKNSKNYMKEKKMGKKHPKRQSKWSAKLLIRKMFSWSGEGSESLFSFESGIVPFGLVRSSGSGAHGGQIVPFTLLMVSEIFSL